jgi:hypothetical protein
MKKCTHEGGKRIQRTERMEMEVACGCDDEGFNMACYGAFVVFILAGIGLAIFWAIRGS